MPSIVRLKRQLFFIGLTAKEFKRWKSAFNSKTTVHIPTLDDRASRYNCLHFGNVNDIDEKTALCWVTHIHGDRYGYNDYYVRGNGEPKKTAIDSLLSAYVAGGSKPYCAILCSPGEHDCPKCGGRMIIKSTTKKKYSCGIDHRILVCGEKTDCRTLHAVAIDGRILSYHADSETKAKRIELHEYLDSLHSGSQGRKNAYYYMAEVLGIDIFDTHIGYFNKTQCQTVINHLKNKLTIQPNFRF